MPFMNVRLPKMAMCRGERANLDHDAAARKHHPESASYPMRFENVGFAQDQPLR
jgi:hypothetical protein